MKQNHPPEFYNNPDLALIVGAFILAWGAIEHLSYLWLMHLEGQVPDVKVRKSSLDDRIKRIMRIAPSIVPFEDLETVMEIWEEVRSRIWERNRVAHCVTMIDEHNNIQIMHVGDEWIDGRVILPPHIILEVTDKVHVWAVELDALHETWLEWHDAIDTNRSDDTLGDGMSLDMFERVRNLIVDLEENADEIRQHINLPLRPPLPPPKRDDDI